MNGLSGPNPTETVTGGKTLELSKYDKVRRPHKTINDDMKIKVTARNLSTELCCPICLDLLTCTMTTKECLHRFCSECITTALMRGNKECPTCRKKIVSKRSLRPDPNFDHLISKIWPDRKMYDAELSASMELFQKQSNVQSLQKSIEEGIKAQAAYRKQRVQGSYDYEKRKRRPKLGDPAASSQQAAEDELDLGTSSIEQVTVSLAPAHLDLGADPQQFESPLESPPSSTEDLNSDNDSSDDDSSSLSSDSSLSSSSSSLSHSATPQRTIAPSAVEEQTISSTSTADESKIDVQQMEEMRRKAEDVELELAPSQASLCRQPGSSSNPGTATAAPITSRFIRTSSDTTIAALGEFLFQAANKSAAAAQLGAEKDNATGMVRQTVNQPLCQPLQSPPDHFFIVDHRHQLRKLNPSETVASAFLHSIPWDRHLVIFFDSNPSENGQQTELAAVIGPEMAKVVDNWREERAEASLAENIKGMGLKASTTSPPKTADREEKGAASSSASPEKQKSEPEAEQQTKVERKPRESRLEEED